MRNTLPRSLFPLALAAAVAACPDDPTESDKLEWLRDGGDLGNASELVVDATSKEAWTYVSFANGVVEIADPATSLEWDLGFRRDKIRTNGGASGSGRGAAADLGKLDLQETTTASVSSWVEDESIVDARTGATFIGSSLLSGWYDYHFGTHQLRSKYLLYAVRTADGRTALMKVYDYYDDVGTAAHYTIVYRYPVQTGDGPAPDAGSAPDAGPAELPADVVTESDGVVRGETTFDASVRWSHFSFENRGAVTLDRDPKESTAWDLAFDQWLVATNSGTSGSGGGGALLSEVGFDEAVTAPTTGYDVDTVQTIGAEQRLESVNPVTAGWFEYDSTTQKIRSIGATYWIRTATGRYAKLRLLDYYHPDGTGGFYRLQWAYRPDGGTEF